MSKLDQRVNVYKVFFKSEMPASLGSLYRNAEKKTLERKKDSGRDNNNGIFHAS